MDIIIQLSTDFHFWKSVMSTRELINTSLNRRVDYTVVQRSGTLVGIQEVFVR